eukprot:365676-Chlamydomonas_euryale.AAC.4
MQRCAQKWHAYIVTNRVSLWEWVLSSNPGRVIAAVTLCMKITSWSDSLMTLHCHARCCEGADVTHKPAW